MKHQHTHASLWPGVPLALASAALFGATPPFSKLLMQNVSPLMLAGLLYLGAGIGLAVYHFLFRTEPREASLQRQDWPWLAAAVIMGGIIGPVLLMFGLTLVPASSGALLLNLEGLATMLIAWLVFNENVDRRLFIGALSILAGSIILSWDGAGIVLSNGTLLVAGACLAWGIDNNLSRKISAADPIFTVMIKGLVAGSVNVGLALISGAQFPVVSITVAAATLGLLGVGISLVMFILALRHLGTARTGAYFSLAPFIGAVIAVFLLSEPVTLTLLIAGSLMALGLWLHLTERHVHEHSHSTLEHDHVHTHDAHHSHVHGDATLTPHAHPHRHEPLKHAHVHYPDLHHRHNH